MSLKHGKNYLRGERAITPKDDKTIKEVVEELPDQAVKRALNDIRLIDCPECGEEMFYIPVAGHNTTQECRHCGQSYKIVG